MQLILKLICSILGFLETSFLRGASFSVISPSNMTSYLESTPQIGMENGPTQAIGERGCLPSASIGCAPSRLSRTLLAPRSTHPPTQIFVYALRLIHAVRNQTIKNSGSRNVVTSLCLGRFTTQHPSKVRVYVGRTPPDFPILASQIWRTLELQGRYHSSSDGSSRHAVWGARRKAAGR